VDVIRAKLLCDIWSWVDNNNNFVFDKQRSYTRSEAWSGVNWADLMAAQGALGPIFMTGLPERWYARCFGRSIDLS